MGVGHVPLCRHVRGMEVLQLGHGGTGTLGRIRGGLRGHDPEHRDEGKPMVCSAGRQQVVHPTGGFRGGR